MTKWIAEVLAVVLSMGAITPLHGEQPLGREIVVEVEKDYKRGVYDTFLEQFDEQYQRAGHVGAVRSIFERAKKAIPTKVLASTFAEKHKQKVKELYDERNKALIDAIAEDGDADIAKKVDSVIYFNIDPQMKDLLAEFDLLKYKAPEEVTNTVENKISAIQTEFYIKSLLLNIAHEKAESSPQVFLKKKIALELQKFEKMEAVAKASDDPVWLKKVQVAKEAYRLSLAHQIDLDTLRNLASGKIQPQNETEERVKAVMEDHLLKKNNYFQELAQK